MKRLQILLLLLPFTAASDDKDELYHQCLLKNAPKAQLPQVWHKVKQSCHMLHRELVVLPDKKRITNVYCNIYQRLNWLRWCLTC